MAQERHVELQSLPEAKLMFVLPMLATPVETLPEGRQRQYDIKLDGYRAVVVKNDNRVTVFSRRGRSVCLTAHARVHFICTSRIAA